MASPTFNLTIIDKKDNELFLDVSACNHPNQTVPQKKLFVWIAILDAFYQRYRSGYIIKKLHEEDMVWKEDISSYPYSTLFQLHAHTLEEWLGRFKDTDDLSFYEEGLAEFIAEFKTSTNLVDYCTQLKSYPKLSELIKDIEVLEEGRYKLDEENDEDLPMKILKIQVSDKDFIAHCAKGDSWEVYWW